MAMMARIEKDDPVMMARVMQAGKRGNRIRLRKDMGAQVSRQ